MLCHCHVLLQCDFGLTKINPFRTAMHTILVYGSLSRCRQAIHPSQPAAASQRYIAGIFMILAGISSVPTLPSSALPVRLVSFGTSVPEGTP
jgi:hypothetical protein